MDLSLVKKRVVRYNLRRIDIDINVIFDSDVIQQVSVGPIIQIKLVNLLVSHIFPFKGEIISGGRDDVVSAIETNLGLATGDCVAEGRVTSSSKVVSIVVVDITLKSQRLGMAFGHETSSSGQTQLIKKD